MRHDCRLLMLLLLTVTRPQFVLPQDDATELLDGAHILGYAPNLVVRADMEIHGTSGQLDRTVQFHLRNEAGGATRVLAQIIRPAYLMSMRFLMHRTDDGRQDRWVTTSRGVRRLTDGDGDERIFGSTFTARELSSLDHAGSDLALLDINPSEALIRTTAPDRQVRLITIDRESRIIRQIDYLTASGHLSKRYRVTEIGVTNGFSFPRIARMDDFSDGTYTILRMHEVEVVDSIPDRVFSRANL